ncbi:MAG: Maf family nucleotide pyrophosphatase [Bacteroidia bacterium]
MQHPLSFSNFKIILASGSPRRKELLLNLDIPFTVKVKPTDEIFPAHLKADEIAVYLSKKKSDAFVNEINDNEIIITADTIVWLNNEVLNKPINADEAKTMLVKLSGNWHTVYTGVTILKKSFSYSFYDETKVKFKELDEREIDYYIQKYIPLDKAGAYGAQDWIGLMAIERLEGSYFNVMGLPVEKVYNELKRLIQ